MLSKYLDPKNDYAFKRIFGTEKNKEILLQLLNSVLKNQIHKSVVEVTFLRPIQDPEIAARKQSIVDILCKDQDGCQYVIEMQVASQSGFEARAQYYAAKAFTSQMGEGQAYETLKEVIFLAFTNFSIFPDKEDYKSEHVILDKKTHERNLDKFSFTFVDLPKFDAQRSRDLSKLTLEEKFYYFLHHAGEIKPEELKQLIGQDKIIKKAFRELDHFYWTEEEMLSYEQEQKRERDHVAIMSYATKHAMEAGRKQGVEEGRKQGVEEGMEKRSLEIAKHLLQQGMDPKTIAKVTGMDSKMLDSLKPHNSK